jgi:hypothetical protein
MTANLCGTGLIKSGISSMPFNSLASNMERFMRSRSPAGVQTSLFFPGAIAGEMSAVPMGGRMQLTRTANVALFGVSREHLLAEFFLHPKATEDDVLGGKGIFYRLAIRHQRCRKALQDNAGRWRLAHIPRSQCEAKGWNL